jgi:transposase-like protein
MKTFCLICDKNYLDNLPKCPHCNRTNNDQILDSIKQQKDSLQNIRKEAVAAAEKAAEEVVQRRFPFWW